MEIVFSFRFLFIKFRLKMMWHQFWNIAGFAILSWISNWACISQYSYLERKYDREKHCTSPMVGIISVFFLLLCWTKLKNQLEMSVPNKCYTILITVDLSNPIWMPKSCWMKIYWNNEIKMRSITAHYLLNHLYSLNCSIDGIQYVSIWLILVFMCWERTLARALL